MSIAEKKALEAYPICNCYNEECMMQEDVNIELRTGYEEGYDQAMQDMARDADRLQYLSDELGYAYACGCKKTTQDFMEKAEEAISQISRHFIGEDYSFDQIWEQFKNNMSDEM